MREARHETGLGRPLVWQLAPSLTIVAAVGAVLCFKHLPSRAAPASPPIADKHQTLRRWDPRDESQYALLSVSHILLRHSGCANDVVPLSLLDWRSRQPESKRSETEALKEATVLAARLRQQPEAFERLARELSEDVATKNFGGKIGIFAVNQFAFWPQILDAIERLKPGDVSLPVVTRYGVHIFRVDALPPRQRFASKRIVIGYSGAGFLKFVARSAGALAAAEARSKDAAFNIAADLARRSTPTNFDRLVAEYSDHRDARRSGDMGLWSSREPTIYPRLLPHILSLDVGAVSEPLDSELGYQIVLRTESTPREPFAMVFKRFAYSWDDDDRDSKERAWRAANDCLAGWRQALQSREPETLLTEGATREWWTSGRGADGAEEALRQVGVGQATSQPFISDRSVVAAVRVMPPAKAMLDEDTGATPSGPARADY